jgi:hypothetical protein
MKILICGDSFAADWTVKYPGKGWPNLVAEKYQVTNLAQAGCGEYKIYKQLMSVNLSQFDKIIVSHTSPYRLHVEKHPVHFKDLLHQNSDLIYTDLKEHSKTNKTLLPIIEYFENYFNEDFAKFTHTLICEKIDQLLQGHTALHLIHLDWNDLYKFDNMLNFQHLFKPNKGFMNHYNDSDNQSIMEVLEQYICG